MDRLSLSEDEGRVQVRRSRLQSQWISSRGPECHSACGVVRHLRGGFPVSKIWKNKLAFAASATMVLGALLAFAGCEEKGPAEKAGESIDKGIQNAKDAVTQPGPGEKAGRAVDKAVKP